MEEPAQGGHHEAVSAVKLSEEPLGAFPLDSRCNESGPSRLPQGLPSPFQEPCRIHRQRGQVENSPKASPTSWSRWRLSPFPGCFPRARRAAQRILLRCPSKHGKVSPGNLLFGLRQQNPDPAFVTEMPQLIPSNIAPARSYF